MPNVHVTQPTAAVAINKRFFQALDYLVSVRRVRGYQTIISLWGIDRRNLAKLKAEPDRRTLKPEYIYYLERDFGISSRWVVMGHGRMLLNTHQKEAKNAISMQDIESSPTTTM